jgi:hypothetical protein
MQEPLLFAREMLSSRDEHPLWNIESTVGVDRLATCGSINVRYRCVTIIIELQRGMHRTLLN